MTASRLADPEAARRLAYALAWRVHGAAAGVHRATAAGIGGDFERFVPFDQYPDGRRIDLRATLRDPWRRIQVRRFRARAPVAVRVLVDLTGSMAFAGTGCKQETAAALVEAIAIAARTAGDPIGVTAAGGEPGGCAASDAPGIAVDLSPRRGGLAPETMADAIAEVVPHGAGVDRLVAAVETWAGRRALVFLVSDFRIPPTDLARLLDAVGRHDVNPIVLDDPAERDWPRFGIGELDDLETGRRRLVLFRPRLVERLRAAEVERRARLDRAFATAGLRPFRIEGPLDLDAFADHLLGG